MAKKNSSQSTSTGMKASLGGIVVIIIAMAVYILTGGEVDLANISDTLNGTGDGDTLTQPSPPPSTGTGNLANLTVLTVGQGRGYEKGFWQVYFNEPSGSSDSSTYVDGLDVPLANAIDQVERTLDISAFEMNNEVIEEAILRAHDRGVVVRVVTDDEHGLEDPKDFSMENFIEAGIPVVDDGRSALMHNKFMIMDGTTVWTGSWNYTINGTYRNNNNALVLRSQRVVEIYQTEFNEMFEDKEFGPTSSTGGSGAFTFSGTPIEIYFASEDDILPQLVEEIENADTRIRFMTFVFSEDAMRDAIVARGEAVDGLVVEGIFENRNSTADWSELPSLFCAGYQMRQDGNPYTLHHKVFIIDDDTVITGSFNFSASALDSNDENLVIIRDADLAAAYNEEFDRLWEQAEVPDDVTCD